MKNTHGGYQEYQIANIPTTKSLLSFRYFSLKFVIQQVDGLDFKMWFLNNGKDSLMLLRLICRIFKQRAHVDLKFRKKAGWLSLKSELMLLGVYGILFLESSWSCLRIELGSWVLQCLSHYMYLPTTSSCYCSNKKSLTLNTVWSLDSIRRKK